MRYYWIQDQVTQNQLSIYWAPRNSNLADYFTKHHPTLHHCRMLQHYLINQTNINKNLCILKMLQGFFKMSIFGTHNHFLLTHDYVKT